MSLCTSSGDSGSPVDQCRAARSMTAGSHAHRSISWLGPRRSRPRSRCRRTARTETGDRLVHDVAELVEERDHLVVPEQAGPVAPRRREVRDERGERGDPPAVGVLPAAHQVERRRVAELPLARIEVEVDPAEQRAVDVADLAQQHVVVPRPCGVLLRCRGEGQPEQLAEQVERRLQHARHREVLRQRRRVEPHQALGPDPPGVLEVPQLEPYVGRLAVLDEQRAQLLVLGRHRSGQRLVEAVQERVRTCGVPAIFTSIA